MSTKMTEEAKARLREVAASKKGRDTLQGLDQTVGGIGLDFVMDQQASAPLPEVKVAKNGYVLTPGPHGMTAASDDEGAVSISYWRVHSESKNPTIPWVRLKQCPQWVFDEFASRWTVRKIAFQSYKGPQTGTEWETVTVVPIDIAVAWFRFLWPEEDQWGKRVKKYFTGFTEGWIQKYPGVGAQLKLESMPDQPELDQMPARVTKISPESGRTFCRVGDGSTVWLMKTDKWEVIG